MPEPPTAPPRSSNFGFESTRMVLDVTPSLARKLDDLGRRLNLPREEVLLRAILLYDVAAEVAGPDRQLRISAVEEGPADEGEDVIVSL